MTPNPPLPSGFFSRMNLRWRLVIAFLSVSVLPVLLASFVAAQAIATLFERNLEHWLADAAHFIADESMDSQREAERAVTIVAAGLQAGCALDTARFAISAELLTAVGYDLAVIYDRDENVLQRYGHLDGAAHLPTTTTAGFFSTQIDGREVLLIGAVRRFEANGRELFLLIAGYFDENFIDLSNVISSLDARIFRVQDGRAYSLATADAGAEQILPPGLLEQLAARRTGLSASLNEGDDLETGFAPMLDASGKLVGVVSVQLSNDVAYLAHVRTWSLFLALALGTGLLSLMVGLLLSKHMTGPLRALSHGLRHVREGDYKATVPVSGDREFAELAAGFNSMAAQLDSLRQREFEMRQREQLATLGEAAATIAHEIRNPLGIIKTSSQVLRMKSALSIESDRLVGFVLDEVERIDGLVKDLLDYVKPLETVSVRLDLFEDVVAGVLEFAAPELARRGIVSDVVQPDGPTLISGNAAQLHQALLNILLNAMDAMPNGGRLTVSAKQLGAIVLLQIQDTGIGISATIRERIFQPFVTDKPRGTGLGLAKVWSVMERHGGHIDFESMPGMGTTFTLHFPGAQFRTADFPAVEERTDTHGTARHVAPFHPDRR
ncbi:MAG: two-component sensor histidine kinase [Rubritepida sp.]|nr:two-component sensor histidine kinase [Rubritepida sp.]